MPVAASPASLIESRYAWTRLWISLLIMSIGSSGMYTITVVLPHIQAEFGVSRGDASLPYTATLVGFSIGGVLMGRLADRFGVMVPVMLGGVGLGLGYMSAGLAPQLAAFCLAQGLLIGMLGSSATFAPLSADTSKWFDRRRGIALAICMSGNYAAGTIWPPVMQHFIDGVGWRQTYIGAGIFCMVTMVPLALVLRRRPPGLVPRQATRHPREGGDPVHPSTAAVEALDRRLRGDDGIDPDPRRNLGLTPNALTVLLCIAGLSCCVAMSMPQVHIVAYCSDLGFGPARGAEMLSLMLGMGIASRLLSGWISDYIGGLRTLLLGSMLQGVALLFFLPFKGLVSLYLISAMFGLFQGGIVPAYALIVREHFPVSQAGARVGIILMSTLVGMAVGGWMSGAVFDLTGSYQAAFVNGIVFNLVNVSVVLFLLHRLRARARGPAVVAA